MYNNATGHALSSLTTGVEFETEERQFPRTAFLTVSHRWCRPSRDPAQAHPDTADARKHGALKRYLGDEARSKQHPFVWMDWMSVPQDPGNREIQSQAISSLRTYFRYSGSTLILTETMETLRNQEQGYLSRGHCLMELASMKLPRTDIFNAWYVPGFDPSGDWGSATVLQMETGEAVTLEWRDFETTGSPIDGNFTIEADRPLMVPLVQGVVAAYEAFQRALAPLREATAWQELYAAAEPETKIQTWKASERYPTPSAFADALLPPAYLQMLKASLQRHSRVLTGPEYNIYVADFNKFDADGDGLLDDQEVVALLTEQLGKAPTAAAVATYFAEVDRNRDGVVSLEEYITSVVGAGWAVEGG